MQSREPRRPPDIFITDLDMLNVPVMPGRLLGQGYYVAKPVDRPACPLTRH